jgi:hypothetical protein
MNFTNFKNFFGHKLFFLLFAFVFSLLLFFNFSRLNHPATEFDEGVYVTTFQLANAGHPLYKETFFSQFPGFFLVVNPIFSLFDQTLQAGRIGILFWSFIGIFAIIWIGYELSVPLFAFIAIASLYMLPLYVTEISTFHTDSLPSVFSLIALAAMLRFTKVRQTPWLLLSAVAFSMAVLVKLDITILPSLIFLLIIYNFCPQKLPYNSHVKSCHPREGGDPEENTKNFMNHKTVILIKHLGIFLVAFLISILIFTLPFGLVTIGTTIIPFRSLVLTHTVFDSHIFFQLLVPQQMLVLIIVAGLVLTSIAWIKKIGNPTIYIVFLLWLFATGTALFSLHPLFLHHMVLLTIPSTLLFSYAVAVLLAKLYKPQLLMVSICALIILFIGNMTVTELRKSHTVEINNEATAIQIVRQTTQPNDYVISDDGIINGVTHRLSPPPLSDLSFVRLQSGDITPEKFEAALQRYSPKLIVVWTHRLNTLPEFDQILVRNNYKLLYQTPQQQTIYIRSTQLASLSMMTKGIIK